MPQTITIHSADSSIEPFDVEFTDEQWINVQAFCEASGLTIDEVVAAALREFFSKDRTDGQ